MLSIASAFNCKVKVCVEVPTVCCPQSEVFNAGGFSAPGGRARGSLGPVLARAQ